MGIIKKGKSNLSDESIICLDTVYMGPESLCSISMHSIMDQYCNLFKGLIENCIKFNDNWLSRETILVKPIVKVTSIGDASTPVMDYSDPGRVWYYFSDFDEPLYLDETFIRFEISRVYNKPVIGETRQWTNDFLKVFTCLISNQLRYAVEADTLLTYSKLTLSTGTITREIHPVGRDHDYRKDLPIATVSIDTFWNEKITDDANNATVKVTIYGKYLVLLMKQTIESVIKTFSCKWVSMPTDEEVFANIEGEDE